MLHRHDLLATGADALERKEALLRSFIRAVAPASRVTCTLTRSRTSGTERHHLRNAPIERLGELQA